MLNIHLLYKKLALIITGAIISAFGITLALCEGFGGATLAVLWRGYNRSSAWRKIRLVYRYYGHTFRSDNSVFQKSNRKVFVLILC